MRPPWPPTGGRSTSDPVTIARLDRATLATAKLRNGGLGPPVAPGDDEA